MLGRLNHVAIAVPDIKAAAETYRSTFANLLGLRFVATGVPVERIDRALKPGDLNFIADLLHY